MSWMMIADRDRHQIAQHPEGVVWAMYCPRRGPESLIYCPSFAYVLAALERDTECPHDELLYTPRRAH